MALHSFLSSAPFRAATTVVSLLPKATFTLSIQPSLGLPSQPNLGLPSNRAPPTPSSTPFYLYIPHRFSPCSSHLNILSNNSTRQFSSIPALLQTSSFLTLSIRVTLTGYSSTIVCIKILHLKHIHSSSLYTSHTPWLRTIKYMIGTITPSYRHFFSILYFSSNISALQTSYTHNSLCIPHSFDILHTQPIATPSHLLPLADRSGIMVEHRCCCVASQVLVCNARIKAKSCYKSYTFERNHTNSSLLQALCLQLSRGYCSRLTAVKGNIKNEGHAMVQAPCEGKKQSWANHPAFPFPLPLVSLVVSHLVSYPFVPHAHNFHSHNFTLSHIHSQHYFAYSTNVTHQSTQLLFWVSH